MAAREARDVRNGGREATYHCLLGRYRVIRAPDLSRSERVGMEQMEGASSGMAAVAVGAGRDAPGSLCIHCCLPAGRHVAPTT